MSDDLHPDEEGAGEEQVLFFYRSTGLLVVLTAWLCGHISTMSSSVRPLDCCNDDELEVSKAIVQGCGLKNSLKMMINRSLLTEFCVA